MVIFAVHSRQGLGTMVSRQRFVYAISAAIIFFASDTIWYGMDQGVFTNNLLASIVLKSIYFLSATVSGYLWFIYLETAAGAAFVKDRRLIFRASIFVWIHVILALINAWNGMFFYFDDAMKYYRGNFFWLQYVFIYIYLIAACVHALVLAFKPENYIERDLYIVLASFPMLPIFCGIMQWFYWRMPFNCVGITLSAIIVYLNAMIQQISLEPLTQLNNRKQFMKSLEQLMKTHGTDGEVYLFMLDMNRFKVINDTYGHMEGDKALLLVSDALKRAVGGLKKRATLARFGGDEFVIVACLDSDAEADKLKEEILKEIEFQNTKVLKNYVLSLSIGYANNTGKSDGIRELISAADEALYVEKEKAHAAEKKN